MKLSHRLLLQSVAVVAILTASVVLILDKQLLNRITEQSTQDLAGEARFLARLWRPGVDADALADEAGAATGHRTTLIDGSGKVVGDSEFDEAALAALDNHSDRPEVITARSGRVGSSRRMSPSTGEEQLYVAVAAAQGVARVSVTTTVLEGTFARARRGVIAASLIAFLLAAALSALFSRAVSQPITDLRDITRSLAAGDFARRPALTAPGEVGDLADAIHRLAEQLEGRLSALAAEQSMLSSLVETLNEGVIAVSADQRVVRINDIGRHLLRVDRVAPFNLDFLPRATPLRAAIASALAGKATEGAEVNIGGNTLSLTARPLVGGGAVVGLFDLTPIRRLETVRRDFVANVSHELRTPLTIIGGFAETLQDPEIPPDKQAAFARTILSNAQRMQRIVDELLDLSRIETGHWQPRLQAIRIGDLAAEICARLSPMAQARGIALETQIDQQASIIYADRTALEQILLNLTENALRHTRAGTVAIRTRTEGGNLVLSVEDTGTGVAPEHLPRIFERFYRVDTGRSRESGGTGLGLAIVKHLVEAHGGSVRAESSVGRGTTISIYLPPPPRTQAS